MMYILAFLLGCGIFWFAYEVGKAIGGSQGIEELERLRTRNECLQRSVDFVNAELDHARTLLDKKVAAAHESKGVYGVSQIELNHADQQKYSADLRRGLDKYLTADVSWHLPDAARAQMYCFHGISLSDHCGRCAQQNFAAGGIEN
jgi:hypothetical protein